MVAETSAPREMGNIESTTYKGGIRWRRFTNVSWPLTELTVGVAGISVKPSSSRVPALWRLLGIPTLSVDWSRIDGVELVKSIFSLGRSEGVSFMVEDRRLVFGCDQAVAESILDEVARFVGGKIIQRTRPKLVI